MKANELMIGDWVSYKGKMPCKITAICKDTAVVDNRYMQNNKPTHWMPLPQVPVLSDSSNIGKDLKGGEE